MFDICGVMRSGLRIKLQMPINEAVEFFKSDASWYIETEEHVRILQTKTIDVSDTQEDETEIEFDLDGNPIYRDEVRIERYDKSEYSIAGEIVDHRNGFLDIYMGKPTDLEIAYELLYGGI